jgi:hypothetical protein
MHIESSMYSRRNHWLAIHSLYSHNTFGLDEVEMQRIAREFNISETAFMLPPTSEDCAARVRIFSPTGPAHPRAARKSGEWPAC